MPVRIKTLEKGWLKQGIKEPDGSASLSYETYKAVREFQDGRCACCDKILFLDDRRGEAADHDHKTGLFRGVLCGAKRGCNFRFVGKVERYNIRLAKRGTGEEAALRYLKDVPAQRWLHNKCNTE